MLHDCYPDIPTRLRSLASKRGVDRAAALEAARLLEQGEVDYVEWTALADVPSRIGSLVRPKRGPASAHVWEVYDHHGGTWPLGEDVSRVVLVRDAEHRDGCPAEREWHFTTFGRIETA